MWGCDPTPGRPPFFWADKGLGVWGIPSCMLLHCLSSNITVTRGSHPQAHTIISSMFRSKQDKLYFWMDSYINLLTIVELHQFTHYCRTVSPLGLVYCCLKDKSGKNTINLRVRATPQLSLDTKIFGHLDISPLIICTLSCHWAQPFWQPSMSDW